MGFFEGIFDLVGEGIDCVMDGVIAVGEFAEEHPVATSLAVNVATSGMAAWSNAGTIATILGGTGVLGNTATTGVAISSLSGAAATNASLAALGGGALSAGGGGIGARYSRCFRNRGCGWQCDRRNNRPYVDFTA